MSNKIEEGCLAIIVSADVRENLEKTMTVGSYLGKIDGWRGDNWWEVDVPMISTNGDVVYKARSDNLLRIDNLPEEDKVIEKELELNLN